VAIGKGKPDGGQGGRLGHSNQDHWEYTEEVKEAARKRRRQTARAQIVEGITEHETDSEPVKVSDEFSQ
jgi:hypothetical protein